MSHSKQVSQTANLVSNEKPVDPSIQQKDTRIIATAAATSAADPSHDTPSSSSPLMQLTKNQNLLQALAKQMNYYFSEQNLAQDTYLNTIMNLNSGYVPITILGGFANINRIVARFATEANVDMALLNPLFVMSLLRQSVIHAEGLEIASLDQSGKVVVSPQQQQQNQEDDQYQHSQQQLQGEEEYEKHHGKSVAVFEAIGRNSSKGSGTKNIPHLHSENGRVVVDTDASKKDDLELSTKSNTVVILREVSTDATEQDVRAVFQCEENGDVTSPVITKIQKEVGQCWFVTLDASTSQQDMVSILLNLRNKKLCNEPIKARLKTTSATTRDANGGVSKISSYSTYRNSDASQHVKIYSGDRVNYSFRESSKPFSRQRGGSRGTDHHGFHKKGYTVEGRKVYKSDSKKIPSTSSSPPPPLVDEHFPGLVGSTPIGASTDPMGGDDKVMPKEMSNSITGYAAALLKAAPPVTEVSTKVIKKSSAELSKASVDKKVEDANSTGTVSTEGSSADDKSHTSKSEAESCPVAASSAVKSWSAGRSFADVLKKQDK